MNRQNRTVTFTHAWDRPYYPAGESEKAYLLLEARGTGPACAAQRAPINLSLVLDRSGSMAGDPLAFSKKACQFVTDQMNSEDVLSLVVFDDEIRTVLPPANVTHKDLMKRRIEAIGPGGSTNLSGGLIEGAQHARKQKKDGMVNRVILLSDGHANRGITDRAKLAAIAAEYRSSGVGVTTMGVGDGFDEELMEAVSERGGGNFYYIDTPDKIPSIFQEELQGLLSVIAQNMKLTLQPSGLARITGIYAYQAEEGSTGHTLPAGDLYYDEVKSVLVELTLHPHAQGCHSVLNLIWEYMDVTEGPAACSFACEVKAEFTGDLELLALPSHAGVQKQIELTESAKTIEAAMEALDSGDLQTGIRMLREQADHMMRVSEKLDEPSLAMESSKLMNRLENFEYSDKTRKELHEQKYRQKKRK